MGVFRSRPYTYGPIYMSSDIYIRASTKFLTDGLADGKLRYNLLAHSQPFHYIYVHKLTNLQSYREIIWEVPNSRPNTWVHSQLSYFHNNAPDAFVRMSRLPMIQSCHMIKESIKHEGIYSFG